MNTFLFQTQKLVPMRFTLDRFPILLPSFLWQLHYVFQSHELQKYIEMVYLFIYLDLYPSI
jgi:hypothetical protein